MLNLKDSDNILEVALNLGKYFWDRWPGLYGELMEQGALNSGMDPEYAKMAENCHQLYLLKDS